MAPAYWYRLGTRIPRPGNMLLKEASRNQFVKANEATKTGQSHFFGKPGFRSCHGYRARIKTITSHQNQ